MYFSHTHTHAHTHTHTRTRNTHTHTHATHTLICSGTTRFTGKKFSPFLDSLIQEICQETSHFCCMWWYSIDPNFLKCRKFGSILYHPAAVNVKFPDKFPMQSHQEMQIFPVAILLFPFDSDRLN